MDREHFRICLDNANRAALRAMSETDPISKLGWALSAERWMERCRCILRAKSVAPDAGLTS